MLGAIIGDIVGSVYERHPIKTKDFPFFADNCFFTPEGMKGARATTHAIWLASHGEDPTDIRKVIASKYGDNLTQTVDQIRPSYFFDITCQGTVPQAITCALESVSFEGAVRNAISLSGDADTLSAIAGSIAEAMHGIPDELKAQAESLYLTDAPDILEVIQKMY